MDNKALLRAESTLHQIKNKLLSDPEIRKLLFYSSSEVKDSFENLKEVSAEAVKDNIFLQLILDVDTKPPFDKSNFIAIRLSSADYEDQKIDYVIDITVASEKHDWILGGKIRPILLAQKIVELLDGQKFEFSNSIYFYRMMEQVLNDDVTGYTLIFGASDGTHTV